MLVIEASHRRSGEGRRELGTTVAIAYRQRQALRHGCSRVSM